MSVRPCIAASMPTTVFLRYWPQWCTGMDAGFITTTACAVVPREPFHAACE
jgi:hypothetical protein